MFLRKLGQRPNAATNTHEEKSHSAAEEENNTDPVDAEPATSLDEEAKEHSEVEAKEAKSHSYEEPDEATQELVNAIYDNDYKAAFNALQKKAKVNILVQEELSDLTRGGKVSGSVTLLQLAVSTLNYGFVKLLLEHGADPNKLNSNNGSTLEMILCFVGDLATQEALGTEEKHQSRFFAALHIQKQSSEKVKLRQNQIMMAEKILDLLLCYGLNPNPEWTASFLQAKKELQHAIEYHNKSADTARDQKRFLVASETATTIIEMGLEEKKGSSFKKKVELGLAKGLIKAAISVAQLYKKARRRQEGSFDHLSDYMLTLEDLQRRTIIATDEINKERGIMTPAI